jgi:hypothetical protein
LFTRNIATRELSPPNSAYTCTRYSALPSASLISRENSQKLATNYRVEYPRVLGWI